MRVITFPPHCTHALQPFDVSIAKKLKTTYTKLFNDATNSLDKEKISSPKRREIAIDCIISSWNMVMNYKSASEAFAKTGMHPFDAGAMLMARGVNTITDKDPEKESRRIEKRLFISSSELTNEAMLARIKKNEISVADRPHHKLNQNTFQSLTFNDSDPIIVAKEYSEMLKKNRNRNWSWRHERPFH